MTYQAKNFKINYLTKPKEDLSNSVNIPQFRNEHVTSVAPIQIVGKLRNFSYLFLEMLTNLIN